MRALGYIRVSTAEQADSGAGLDAQRFAIETEVARRDDLHLADTLVDAGYSAKNTKRPALQETLRRLKAHEADALVVAKLDRLSRSVIDFAQIMELAQRQRWQMILLDSNIDTSTPHGEMVATVIAAMAQLERKLIGARTREAMAAKKRDGARFGRPLTIPKPIRTRIAREHAQGLSFAHIAACLNSDRVPTGQGGSQWWPSTVRAALQAA